MNSYHDEEALDAQVRPNRPTFGPPGRIVSIVGGRTDEELIEDGFVVRADVDGTPYCWRHEKPFMTFIANTPLHGKKISNQKYLLK